MLSFYDLEAPLKNLNNLIKRNNILELFNVLCSGLANKGRTVGKSEFIPTTSVIGDKQRGEGRASCTVVQATLEGGKAKGLRYLERRKAADSLSLALSYCNQQMENPGPQQPSNVG